MDNKYAKQAQALFLQREALVGIRNEAYVFGTFSFTNKLFFHITRLLETIDCPL